MTQWNNVEFDQTRIEWWVFVLMLAGAAVSLAYLFISMLVLGAFGYYVTRPIYRRFDDAIGSDGIAAGMPTLEELEYMNPPLSRDAVQRHLAEQGMEFVSLEPEGERPEQIESSSEYE